MKGYVYVISNKAMPDLCKVGYTMKDPQERAEELNSTGVPHPYEVDYEILVDDPYTLEQKCHESLARYKEGKEWFKCSVALCVDAIRACNNSQIYHEAFLKKEREIECERIQREREAQSAKENEEAKIREEERKAQARIDEELRQQHKKEKEEKEKKREEGDKAEQGCVFYVALAGLIVCLISLASGNTALAIVSGFIAGAYFFYTLIWRL